MTVPQAALDPFDQPTFTCVADNTRGTITLIGENIPDGTMKLVRKTSTGAWQDVRSTSGTTDTVVNTGGFVREDPEAPIGQPVQYRMILTYNQQPLMPANGPARFIERNNINTPDWTHGQQTWRPGTGRTMTILTESGQKYAEVSGTTLAPGATGSRMIADVLGSKITGGRTYRITGEARVRFNDVNLWVDVRDNPPRTWATVKSGFPSWQAISSGLSNVDQAASLWITVYDNGGAPLTTSSIKVLDIPATLQDQWFGFSAVVTLPKTIPSSQIRLRISHGTLLREYGTTWDIGRFGMMDAAYLNQNSLYWFSGDTATPFPPAYLDPAQIKWPDSNFKTYTKSQADIIWESSAIAGEAGGTPGNATSLFYGAYTLYADVFCELSVPDITSPVVGCTPVNLNDPVVPTLGVWFGLISISDLQYSARQSIYSILSRSPQIVVSDVRAWPNGTLTLFTSTLEERKQAIGMFTPGRVLQYRNPDYSMPEGGADGPWYLAIGDVTESRPFKDHRRSERFWNVPFVKVEKPVGLISASTQRGQTWQQVKTNYISWGDALYRNDDWMAVRLGSEDFTDDTGVLVGTTPLPTVSAYDAWSEMTLPT